MAGPLSMIEEHREKFLLVVYALAILMFASLLAPMLGQAWQRAGLTHVLFRVRFLIGLSLEVIATVLVGLFFGLLTLMVVDTKKRFQGVLLFTGGIVGLLSLSSMGLLLPNVDLIANAHWLLGGFVLGVFIGGGSDLLKFKSGGPLEFRQASLAVYYILASMMVIGFMEYHLQYPVPISVTQSGVGLEVISLDFGIEGGTGELITNSALVLGFVATTRQFVQYDAKHDFFVLGPKASGKSLFLVGAYLEALERYSQSDSETPLNPSQDLMKLVGALNRQGEGWFVEATRTQELEDLRFQYVHGSVFPQNVKVSSLDYAGEWLEDIPDAILGTQDLEEMPSTLSRVADGVQGSDTLILLVDTTRWVNGEPLDIEPYFDIVQATDNKNIILVATKADTLAEQFREERGLDAQQYFEDFKQYVNDSLTSDQTVQSLFAQTGGSSEIHPVYYQTKVDEDGERVPMRSNGTVTTVGFDELLDMIGES